MKWVGVGMLAFALFYRSGLATDPGWTQFRNPFTPNGTWASFGSCEMTRLGFVSQGLAARCVEVQP